MRRSHWRGPTPGPRHPPPPRLSLPTQQHSPAGPATPCPQYRNCSKTIKYKSDMEKYCKGCSNADMVTSCPVSAARLPA